jgi:hypothetical protein
VEQQQQPSIRALQEELQALQPNQPKTEPVAPVTEQDHIAEQVAGLKAMFAKMVQDLDRDEPAKVAADNLVSKTCTECYFVQPLINAVCELCGAVPFTWMPAREHPANQELDSLRDGAKAPIDRLQNMLRSGWCSERPERERVVKNLLAAQLRQSEGQQRQIECKPVPPEVGVTDRMVQAAIRCVELRNEKLDLELEEIDREIAKNKTRRSASGSGLIPL